MSWRRILAIFLRIVQQFRRDRRTLALLLTVPVAVTLLVGYIIRESETSLSVAVVDETEVAGDFQPGAELVQALEGSTSLAAAEMPLAEAEDALDDGSVDGIAILRGSIDPSAPGSKLGLELILDGTNPQDSASIARNVNRGVSQVLVQELGSALGLPDLSPEDLVEVQITFVHGGPDFDVVDYQAPALIAFFGFFFVFLLTAVSFLRERAGGTLERLMAAPLSRGEIGLGYMLGFGFFALLQSVAIVLAAVLILRINYEGSLWQVFLLVAIITVGSVNLGIFLSTYARNELQVIQFMPIILVPQGLLGGIIWSVDSFPGWLQVVSRFLPLTYAIDALRNTMIKGEGLTESGVYLNALVLAAFAAFFVGLAARTIRQHVD